MAQGDLGAAERISGDKELLPPVPGAPEAINLVFICFFEDIGFDDPVFDLQLLEIFLKLSGDGPGIAHVNMYGCHIILDGHKRLAVKQYAQQGQAVLAPGYGNRDLIPFGEHLIIHDRPAHAFRNIKFTSLQ